MDKQPNFLNPTGCRFGPSGMPFPGIQFMPAAALTMGLMQQQHQAQARQQKQQIQQQMLQMTSTPRHHLLPRFSPMIKQEDPNPNPTYFFTADDLNRTLFGYMKMMNHNLIKGHALSGLRIGEINHSIDKILSPEGNPQAAVIPPQQIPIDPTSIDLPDGLTICQSLLGGVIHYGVFLEAAIIQKGTRFGPYTGKVVNTSEIKSHDDNSYMWEVFMKGKLSHFIDGRGNAGNWMAYVNSARYAQEQNLTAVQIGKEIYYEVCKDVPRGAELLVWYGETYLQFMGIPVALKESMETKASQQQESENSDGYMCERCGKVFAYKYYRDKHLKYTRCVDMGDRKFPCHLCNRSFEKRDRLRIHILHVHEKHRPHKCTVCNKSFSQSSSLNKHMRVHSGERPYKCVYCNKAFTASSILRTHIRQHSGEKPFKCKHCGKAFASHAAHDSHVRRTHAKDQPFKCTQCSRTFVQSYELKFHMNVHSGGMPSGRRDLTLRSDGDSSDLSSLTLEEEHHEAIDVVGDLLI